MNPPPPLTPAQEQEWGRQERAFEAERRGGSGDGELASYRLLARTLREPLPSAPPAGFAAAIARRVERDALLDGRWERQGIVALLMALVLLAGFGLFAEGPSWLADLQAALPTLPRWFNGWTLLLLAGLGFSQWPFVRDWR
jgi:hypothetical protein